MHAAPCAYRELLISKACTISCHEILKLMLESYYQILDLPMNATKSEVRQAFHNLIKAWHPDRFRDDPCQRLKAEKKTKDIVCAYEAIMMHFTNPDMEAQAIKSPEIKPHFTSNFMASQAAEIEKRMNREAELRQSAASSSSLKTLPVSLLRTSLKIVNNLVRSFTSRS